MFVDACDAGCVVSVASYVSYCDVDVDDVVVCHDVVCVDEYADVVGCVCLCVHIVVGKVVEMSMMLNVMVMLVV